MRATVLALAGTFLGLALGVMVGATRIEGWLYAGQTAAIHRLEAEFQRLRQEAAAWRARYQEEHRRLQQVAELAVSGRLPGWKVRIAVLGQGKEAWQEARSLAAALRRAGAEVEALEWDPGAGRELSWEGVDGLVVLLAPDAPEPQARQLAAEAAEQGIRAAVYAPWHRARPEPGVAGLPGPAGHVAVVWLLGAGLSPGTGGPAPEPSP